MSAPFPLPRWLPEELQANPVQPGEATVADRVEQTQLAAVTDAVALAQAAVLGVALVPSVYGLAAVSDQALMVATTSDAALPTTPLAVVADAALPTTPLARVADALVASIYGAATVADAALTRASITDAALSQVAAVSDQTLMVATTGAVIIIDGTGAVGDAYAG